MGFPVTWLVLKCHRRHGQCLQLCQREAFLRRVCCFLAVTVQGPVPCGVFSSDSCGFDVSVLRKHRENLSLPSPGLFSTTSWKVPPDTSQGFLDCGNVWLKELQLLVCRTELEMFTFPHRRIGMSSMSFGRSHPCWPRQGVREGSGLTSYWTDLSV